MTPLEKTSLAYKNDEVPKLLLGETPYQCESQFLHEGMTTDISMLRRTGLEPYKLLDNQMEEKLIPALYEVLNSPKGIRTVASFILLESKARFRKQLSFNLDLEKLAKTLNQQIALNKEQLSKVKLYGGDGYTDGLLGELKRVSKITTQYNGPNFWL
jgi:hypothetical protein